MYRALLKHANRSPPLPSFVEAAELNAKIAADEIKIALGYPSLLLLTITRLTKFRNTHTVVNKACKGMHGPEVRHILYLKAALKYIIKHKELKLTYKRDGGPIKSVIEKLEYTYPELSGISGAPIIAFSDASHMGLIKDKMRSCTGSAIFTFHCLTQWYHGGQRAQHPILHFNLS